jgi:hypothetical protein
MFTGGRSAIGIGSAGDTIGMGVPGLDPVALRAKGGGMGCAAVIALVGRGGAGDMFAGVSSRPLDPNTGVLLPATTAADGPYAPYPPVLPSRWCIEGVPAKELAPMLRRGK